MSDSKNNHIFKDELSPNHYNQNYNLDHFKKLQSVPRSKSTLTISATPLNKDKTITQLYKYIQ
nr:hypothetical protein [Megavirus caiporensis]